MRLLARIVSGDLMSEFLDAVLDLGRADLNFSTAGLKDAHAQILPKSLGFRTFTYLALGLRL